MASTVCRVGAGLEGGEDPGRSVFLVTLRNSEGRTGSRRPTMDATGDTGKATAPERATAPEAEAAIPAPRPAGDHPFGPDQMGPRSLPPSTGACSRHGR